MGSRRGPLEHPSLLFLSTEQGSAETQRPGRHRQARPPWTRPVTHVLRVPAQSQASSYFGGPLQTHRKGSPTGVLRELPEDILQGQRAVGAPGALEDSWHGALGPVPSQDSGM